ncbi:MAG: pyridoxamine 5'-phosphate oxidase family protein [Streptosporangiales bacterium]|nr:pyridoxamine 5'-phosphate oxidase family protein [Streptosporangiales bacterium]MBO0891312.1 pyridoxamine 5'-phosphate oxidase family protein [Acidothermales bacterium]
MVDQTAKGGQVFEELDREECMRLLASVPVGRLVFTTGGLPAIQPVNFALEGVRILFRTREGSKLVAIRAGTVVGFEVDEIDASAGVGWSVTVVGEARILAEPEAARYRDGAVTTWASGARDEIVAISTPLVTGRRLVQQPASARCSA